MLPYILWHIIYIIEINFKFNNDEIKTEYIELRKQLINWFIQCNTQDENGNDGVDILENLFFYTIELKTINEVLHFLNKLDLVGDLERDDFENFNCIKKLIANEHKENYKHVKYC